MQSGTVLPQQSSPHSQHWQNFFKKFGCVACGRTDVPHIGSGFCGNCRERIIANLTLILQESREV